MQGLPRSQFCHLNVLCIVSAFSVSPIKNKTVRVTLYHDSTFAANVLVSDKD